MFVATNEVPHPPLLEKTAIMRPFLVGAAICAPQNSAVRSSTVRNSSVFTGSRKKSRAPARMLRRMTSGEGFWAAEMIAVDSGLGYLIIDSRNAGKRYDLVVAGMLLIGLIGLGLDIGIRRMERWKSVRWGFANE